LRRGGESADEEKGRGSRSRVVFLQGGRSRFSAGPPDIVFEHVGKGRLFPTLGARPSSRSGKGRDLRARPSGYQLDFDVRYLWMRQKEIVGSHFANAWRPTRANELIEQSKIPSVLWQTMGFEKVAEAHQLSYADKQATWARSRSLVGATEEGQGQDPRPRGPGAISRRGGRRGTPSGQR